MTTNVLSSSDTARVSAAEIEVKSIYTEVKNYMVQNPGPVPSWEEMLERDERGHRFIDSDEPKQDPWGNEYVIAPDVDYPNLPYVQSWGPDGQPDTEDDIDNKTITQRREQ